MTIFFVSALLCLADSATSRTQVSPVQKVVQLLDDLKGKVEGDLAAEKGLMDDYTKWCDEEDNSKEDAITSSKRTINDLEASIQQASASIADLTSEIEELTAKISANEGDLKSASDIRATEHSDFVSAEKELTDTIDTLGRSVTVIKRSQTSFLQNHALSKEMDMITTGLSKIVSASWVDSHQRAVVQSLLQSTQESGDEDLSFQPQASVAAFTSQGGGILKTLDDMKEKADGSLSDSRKGEMESNHAFEMLKQGLNDELSVQRKRMSDASQTRSSTEESMHSDEADLGATKKTLASDEAYLADLRQKCSEKANEWSMRQKSAAEEMGAIEKAKTILVDGVTALLQVSATSTDEASTYKRDQVRKILSGLSKKYHNFALNQLAAKATSDPFGKVRGMIESMIDRLNQEAAEEADGKAFCDEETSKSKAKQAELSSSLDRHATRIEKGEAGKAKLQEGVKSLEAEIAAMDKGQSEATQLRQKENAENTKAISEYKQSAEAVAKAIEVLSSYYSQASFVQVRSRQPELGGAQSDIGNTIVSMLEVAESDFTRLLAETEAEESAASAAHDDLTQKNAVAKASAQEEIRGKKSEIKSLEVALGNYKADHASTGKELDAVLAYLDTLKPQCETKVMSYAERKAKREAEIDGLKEAVAILEG